MTYREYFNLLSAHDWFFSFSDDPNVYDAGSTNLNKLRSVASKSTSSIPRQMLEAWENYIFSGEAWSTVQGPKPKLTDFHTT